MNSIAVHFVPELAVVSLGSLWPYLTAGGAIVFLLLLLLFFGLRSRKRRKSPLKSQKRAVAQNSDLQPILDILQGSNGQARPVLLAATRLGDLPVTVPVNLAVSLSGSGKCLLIDLDSKRDSLAKVFDVDSASIKPDLKVTPIPTEFENLSIWPARYFDLLKQMNLRPLLNAAVKKYDHVLLYAPYLTVLADRKQIASCSKQAIVFCKDSRESTPLHRLLETHHCKILLDT